jgi:TrmH family RNA methyltransferase
LRRLVQKRSLRWSEAVCVLEGPNLVEAALDSAIEFEAIFVDVAAVASSQISAVLARASAAGVRVFGLQEGVLEKVADAQTPQPLLGAVRFPITEVAALAAEGLVLVLHDVRDPGNAGTIIRSADAAGARAVVFTGQSVDPFNPKTLRATAGSIFHLPISVSSLETTLEHFGALGAQTLATVVRDGTSLRDVDLTRPSVVVIGNEASGLDASSIAMCQGSLSIPMAGAGESLNAGVAASLIAFEAMWQRQDATRSAPRPSLEGS